MFPNIQESYRFRNSLNQRFYNQFLFPCLLTHSNVIIAFSTSIGVGGAIAYYMKEIRNLSIGYIILTEIIYILAMIILIMFIKNKLK